VTFLAGKSPNLYEVRAEVGGRLDLRFRLAQPFTRDEAGRASLEDPPRLAFYADPPPAPWWRPPVMVIFGTEIDRDRERLIDEARD
jgi:hypothetical protein